MLAATGGVIEGMVRRELAEDLTARVVAASRPLLGRPDVPEHVRALTSADVLTIEREIVDRITQRAEAKDITIVEGAAGAGKTTRLAATRDRVHAAGHRMVVVTPTRKAAQVAEGVLAGTTMAGGAGSQHRLMLPPEPGPGTSLSLMKRGCSTRTPPAHSCIWQTKRRQD